MLALERRQQVTVVTTAAPTTSDRLADTAATRFLPSATAGGSSTGTDDSTSSVLDIWQYTILVVVVLGAVAFFSTICIFRRQRRRTRARRAARLAAVEDGLVGETEFTARGDFDDAVSMSEMQSTHSRVLPPPAYRERPRSSGVCSTVTSATEVGSDSRPSTGSQTTRPSLSNRLSRFPSAIGSFLNKRVQPNLGGTNVSTDELQTRSAEAQLAATRQQQHRQPTRRSSSTSSIFAFSPRRASSGGETRPVPESPTRRSRLHSEPPSAETLEQVRRIRRALSDAGLLFAPPRSLSDHRLSAGSAASAGGNRPAMLATTHEGLRRFDEEEEAEREIAREERRARRRRRRERERQRMEDEAGLPTYSREVAEGEAVLERAEGWKSAEDDDGDDDQYEHDERSRIEDGGGTNGEQRVRPIDTVVVGEGQEIPVPVLPPDHAAASAHGH